MPGCLDAEGLEWIGGGDGILGRRDWKKFSHAQASGAQRIAPLQASASVAADPSGLRWPHVMMVGFHDCAHPSACANGRYRMSKKR